MRGAGRFGLGCALHPAPDPELYALEPEDIHFVYAIPGGVLR